MTVWPSTCAPVRAPAVLTAIMVRYTIDAAALHTDDVGGIV
jgi:hypothetical protein